MKISKFILCLIGVISLFSCAPKQTGNTDEIPVALQLYTVRNELSADFLGTLCKVKEMGYEGVEFAGLNGYEPVQIKKWCDSLGLAAVSAHVPLADMLSDIDKVITDYKTLGCEYITIPYVSSERRPGGELFMQMVEEIRTIGQKVKDAGLILLYHNHDFEFNKLPNGQTGLDYLYENVSADLLQTELDTCWVNVGGEEPAPYVLKYSGRAPVVHLKDFVMKGKGGKLYELIGIDDEADTAEEDAFSFAPVGSGCQDMPAILAASIAAGAEWVVVEQDRPAKGHTPMQSAEMGREYLKTLGW